MKWTIHIMTLAATLCLGTPVSAQLVASRTARIASGQQHLFVKSVEAHKAFWIGALGGTPAKVGSIVKFENALIVLTPRASGQGTKGSIVDHLAFEVRDLRATIDKLKAHGFPIVTRTELGSEARVEDDIAFVAAENAYVAVAMAPDDVKVEFVENRSAGAAMAMHHVHFATPDSAAMRDWYVRTLGAKPGSGSMVTAELPGVRLTFSPSSGPAAPLKGRVLDHIGFEVRELERFCQELQSRGVIFDRPYAMVPAQNAASAFLIDPWGTHIELTEGLVAF